MIDRWRPATLPMAWLRIFRAGASLPVSSSELNKRTDAYFSQNKMFTKDELAHPQALGAADAPTSADGSGRPADARGFEDACVQAQRPLRLFLQHHIGRSLRSADFLAQVGAPQ